MTNSLKFSGDLSITTVDQLVTSLRQALHDKRPFTIDLLDVERCDTAALQVLLATQRDALMAGIALTFQCTDTMLELFRSRGVQV